MNTNIYISEIMATRLSHDLIGNIGAVANAVELLNEGDEDDREDISNILNFSSKVLSRRLKFFRLCFGLSNAAVKTTEELAAIRICRQLWRWKLIRRKYTSWLCRR